MSRIAPPGKAGQALTRDRERTAVEGGPSPGLRDDFLDDPDKTRLGICTSGGGIRSAAFCLGALQILRERQILGKARYLACVSGGGYISIAHTILVSETLRVAKLPARDGGPPPHASPVEEQYFGRQPPWAPGSPEELHLRNHLAYLAPGVAGRAWALVNLIYGTIRHLLPFLACIYLAGFLAGIGLSSWLDRSLRGERGTPCHRSGCVHPGDLVPFLGVGLALLFLAAVLIAWRNLGHRRRFSDQTMLSLQYVALFVVVVASLELSLLVLLPLTLLWIHGGGLSALTQATAVGLSTLTGALTAMVAWISKYRTSRLLRIIVPVLVTLSAPILVILPFIGFAYWNAQAGGRGEDVVRWVLAVLAAGYLLAAFKWLDEVTSVPHLFYRERLATAFVGYRRKIRRSQEERDLSPDQLFFAQPPWNQPILLSATKVGTSIAKLPDLVVCAAANLSGEDLPAGRLAASFTFEKDRIGGPITGYVTSKWMERLSDGGATLPALIAVSGAAVAPTMGKMTKPAVRFMMALFNLRLGVWLPNPHRSTTKRTAREIRLDLPGDGEGRGLDDDALAKWRRPGALYVFREALGQNHLKRRFIYVTDGGHWENLGLVELLRRGCGDIVCIDGSGGDAESFGTLSEAIALARSDLGVDISINLSTMRSGDDGKSKIGHAVGTITFPDPAKTQGKLVYIRAVLTESSPEEIKSYAIKDKKFPNHPTTDQFFDDERFEAYRELGRHLTSRALLPRRSVAGVAD